MYAIVILLFCTSFVHKQDLLYVKIYLTGVFFVVRCSYRENIESQTP